MVLSQSRVLKNQWMKNATGLAPKRNFPLDGLVLYADLWHPDQQAIGNLTNGTGVATESGDALVIGNNTINVTTQGTFIVYVRGSGTATSGTATVSGSPQSLVSGHNTVTVTGTGTITVALNNVIVSKDTNAHLMTVTGATWGIQGRTTTGSDDYITVSTHASLAITDKISLGGWIKATSSALNQSILGKGVAKWQIYENPSGSWKLLLDTADGAQTVTIVASVAAWNLVFFTYDKDAGANNAIPYLNGAAGTPATITGAIDDTSAANLIIGARGYSLPTSPCNGIYGEWWVYNRDLTAAEILRIYDAIKWRYQ